MTTKTDDGVTEEPPDEILTEAIETVYGRDGTYGSPEDNFATIAGFWNEYLRAGGVEDPNLQPIDVAYMMILLKVSRASNGEYKRDNDVDIAGYAESAARIEAARYREKTLGELFG